MPEWLYATCKQLIVTIYVMFKRYLVYKYVIGGNWANSIIYGGPLKGFSKAS